MSKKEEELIQSVCYAYTDYPQKRLNCTWLTLQSVFNQIILCNGDNDYNIKHLLKEKLKQQRQFPNVLDVVDEANAFDQISIPDTPDTDMDETNLTNPFEHENTNNTNKNTNDTNDNTMHTPNQS